MTNQQGSSSDDKKKKGDASKLGRNAALDNESVVEKKRGSADLFSEGESQLEEIVGIGDAAEDVTSLTSGSSDTELNSGGITSEEVTDDSGIDVEYSWLQQEFPDIYAPWTIRLVLGLEDDSLVRYLYTDREMKEGDTLYAEDSSGKVIVDSRRRLYGEAELDSILSTCVMANVKPDRKAGFVAVDAIRWKRDDGSYAPWGALGDGIGGLHVENSLKTSKRLSTLTRDSFIALAYGNDDLMVEVVGPNDIRSYSSINDPKTLDGANVISRALYKQMVLASLDRIKIDRNSRVGRQIWNRAMKSRSGQFRMLRHDGLWKGDYIISAHEHMTSLIDGELQHVDIRCFHDNCKSEMSWDGGTFLLLEPHPYHEVDPIVRTDDQTMSWLLRHVYDKPTLAKTMRDEGDKVLADLSNGIIPEYLARYNPDNDSDNERHGQISNIQSVVTKFTGRVGQAHMRIETITKNTLPKVNGEEVHYPVFDIRQSRHIINQLGRGHVNRITSPSGNNRFPMPGAARWHVATQAWMNMGDWYGVELTLTGHSRYSEEVQRLVYNDEDFVHNYDNHGGHDLDDVHVVIHGVVRGGRQIFITYRTPNTYGEYSIMNVQPDCPRIPRWTDVNGVIWEPNKITLSKLPKTVHQIKNAPKDSTLPEAARVSGDWDIAAFKDRVDRTFGSRGVGRWVNAQIVYAYSNDAPRERQLVTAEFVVDTHVQDMDPGRIKLCEEDLNLTKVQMQTANGGAAINSQLWRDRRMGRQDWKLYKYRNDGIRAELNTLFKTCVTEYRNKLAIVAKSCGKQVLPILDITRFSADAVEKSTKFRGIWRSELTRGTNIYGNDKPHSFWNETAVRMGTALNKMEDPGLRMRTLLHVAGAQYRNGASDTILFQHTTSMDTCVVDWWIEALTLAAWTNFIRSFCSTGFSR